MQLLVKQMLLIAGAFLLGLSAQASTSYSF